LSLLVTILFLFIGTATAGYVRTELPAPDTGLKQVPYNITGTFTTVSGITSNSASGGFDANNSGIVYNITQHERPFIIGEDISDSPLFFAIDDKHGIILSICLMPTLSIHNILLPFLR
jgi:hypothetical protein